MAVGRSLRAQVLPGFAGTMKHTPGAGRFRWASLQVPWVAGLDGSGLQLRLRLRREGAKQAGIRVDRVVEL
jgi:hypothetical protein